MATAIALIFALGMLVRAGLFEVVQKQFQMTTWTSFSLAQLLIAFGADKVVSGLVLVISTMLLCGMYYTRFSVLKAKRG